MRRTVIFVVLFLSCAAAQAHCPLANHPHRGYFSGVNAISLNQALTLRQQRFERLDVNRDRWISQAELAGLHRAPHRLARLDQNRDQRISAPEWNAGVATLFAHADLNHDKVITRAELKSLRRRAR
jgi:hypothetical protein